MSDPRKILHVDLDAFFCAVEEQRDPSLKAKAFAVGGQPDTRGVVAACSYPARRFGVRSAMPMARAIKLCPDLLIVPSRHSDYGEVSKQVMAILDTLTPLVEQISIDEAFLDITGTPQDAETVARNLQRTINHQARLPCSLGVATNKMVAKIANNEGKAAAAGDGPPNAIRVIAPGQEASFLSPLPVGALWGVGPKTAEHLEGLGIRTVAHLAAWPEDDLVRRFGTHGHGLARYARGIDDAPVQTEHETKSVSKETTFARDVRDRDALLATLLALSEGVGWELRKAGFACSTVSIKFRLPDFTTLTRQLALEDPTDLDLEIYTAARSLFDQVWRKGQPVRLLGVGASRLGNPTRQLRLWDGGHAEDEKIQKTVDDIRERFGRRAVEWGKGKHRSSPNE
jgi:DNA polymerase IV